MSCVGKGSVDNDCASKDCVGKDCVELSWHVSKQGSRVLQTVVQRVFLICAGDASTIGKKYFYYQYFHNQYYVKTPIRLFCSFGELCELQLATKVMDCSNNFEGEFEDFIFRILTFYSSVSKYCQWVLEYLRKIWGVIIPALKLVKLLLYLWTFVEF